MIVYTVISTDEDDYRLTSVSTDNGYEMTSLEFNRESDDIIDFWDNDIYLYETVYPYLKDEITQHSEKLKDEIPPEDCGDVLELFEKGIELGFFENIHK